MNEAIFGIFHTLYYEYNRYAGASLTFRLTACVCVCSITCDHYNTVRAQSSNTQNTLLYECLLAYIVSRLCRACMFRSGKIDL